jgi:hypothetical protein
MFQFPVQISSETVYLIIKCLALYDEEGDRNMDSALCEVAILRLFNENGKLVYPSPYLFSFPLRIFVKTSRA